MFCKNCGTKAVEDVPVDTDDDDESELDDINGNSDSMQWLSYVMSIDISENEPPGSNITPDGRFVHVKMTYISNDAGLGGFLLDDLMGNADFILIDASGNVYEHLGMISPISLDITDGVFEADEIQEVSGVFFDVPVDVELGELIFDIRD